MREPEPLFFGLQSLIVDLALINRDHHFPGQERAENDIEHSFTVTMLCWLIHDKYALPLRLDKLLTYALVHDFVERYAGDTNTYADKAGRARKVELERVALMRLSEEFKNFSGLTAAMHAYESRTDDEALFVWTVDKMQALVLGDMDKWRPYQKIDLSYERFVEKNTELLAASSPYCKEILEGLVAYCQTTYYDRPKIEPTP